MNKFIFGKKGISSAIVDFVGYGVFVVVLVVFYFLFKIGAEAINDGNELGANTIQATPFPESNSQQTLITYLATQVMFNGDKISMADYIVIAASDSTTTRPEQILTKYPLIASILDGYIKNNEGCYIIKIQIESSKKDILPEAGFGRGSACLGISIDEIKALAPVKLPMENGDNLLITFVLKGKNE